MTAEFLTFRTFSDEAQAAETADLLEQNGIATRLENNRSFYDPSYANNAFAADISLKITADNFAAANDLLESRFQNELSQVSEDHYLFQFTDEELVEVITKPDEWGALDYQLAKRLLKERGKEVNPELALLLKKQRNKDLEQPEAAHRYFIVAGYVLAVVGIPISLIIAWTLSYFKKTLPNGKRVFVYREEDRDHGTRILLVTAISLAIWAVIRLFLSEK